LRQVADPRRLEGVRVLVIATEQIAARMAGPAIRSLNLARQLAARGATVTLAMPRLPEGDDGPDLGSITAVAYGTISARAIRPLARASDVVLSQPLRVDVEWALARSGARVVHDLYVPSFVERIAQLGVEPGDERLKRRLLDRDRREYGSAIALGDAFICASERQRDLWLGALGQAGRLDLELLARDPRADRLMGVVPFGVDDADPAPIDSGDGSGRGPIRERGLVPDDAIVALWTGGLWNWFDPVCVVEAIAAARRRDSRVHLVVMGMHHPDSAWQEQDASRRMRERAEELGLLADGGVVLLEEWVPYAERSAWLQDADIAVSAHHDTLETRYSFRTRFLDHLWCGLPTITTAGGDLADAMVDAGAAIAVADGDADAWTAALLALAADPDRRAQMSVAARDLRDAHRWSRTTKPLARIVEGQALAAGAGVPTRRSRRRVRDLVSYMWLLVRVRVQAKGVRSLGAAVRGASSR
jgi:glycosyltransferase involved in cell wall biosynthesis